MEKSRRSFFKKGLAGAILLGTASVAKAGLPDPVKPKAAKAVNPFHLGMAGYTFVNFDLETTLKTLQRLDIHYLCIKDFHLPLDSNDDQIKAFHDKCASYGVTGYAVGPIYMKSEAEIDRGFEYAKRVGVKTIVGVPNYELLPYVDKKVKEYFFPVSGTEFLCGDNGKSICTDPISRLIRMQRTFGNIRKIWTRVSVCVWMLVTIFVTVVILLPT